MDDAVDAGHHDVLGLRSQDLVDEKTLCRTLLEVELTLPCDGLMLEIVRDVRVTKKQYFRHGAEVSHVSFVEN